MPGPFDPPVITTKEALQIPMMGALTVPNVTSYEVTPEFRDNVPLAALELLVPDVLVIVRLALLRVSIGSCTPHSLGGPTGPPTAINNCCDALTSGWFRR